VGPCVVPRGEVHSDDLQVRTYVDGQLKQEGSVREMLFGLDVIIEYVSAVMTLEPGDLIATAPAGRRPLQPGVTVRVERGHRRP